MIYEPMLYKRCIMCAEWKPVCEFYRKNKRTGQVQARCRACHYYAMRHPKPKVSIPDDSRRCSRCKAIKHVSEFHGDASNNYGVYPRCKQCVKETKRKPRKKPILPEGHKRCGRRDKCVHPDGPILPLDEFYWDRGKRHGHCIACVTAMRKRYANNEAHRAAKRRYKQRHQDKTREQAAIRRAQRANADGRFSETDVNMQYERQAGLCYWCKAPLNRVFHRDHVIPLSRGGSNWPNNIVCTCAFCNESKGNKLAYVEWTPPNSVESPYQ